MSRNAPTTPTNASTPSFTTVSSSGGFSAGDLVYQKSNNVGLIPSGTVASANFNISSSVIQTAGILPNTATALGVSMGNGGSSLVSPSAAKLTNGNMVVVWVAASGGSASFRIINEAGTEVVATTSMGSGNTNNPVIAVATLTGGGFAAVWANGSNQFAYAVYNNAGTVVTAATTETSIGLSSSSLTVAPRPDGSFIAVVNDTSASQARFKVYSATGVQVIAWTNVAGYTAARARTAVAVRSDNSFVIGAYTSATNIQYYLYSSTGVAGSNSSVVNAYNATSSNGHLDMATITNNSVVFTYISSGNLPVVKILNSSNTFILDTAVSASTSYTCSVVALSAGGFVATWDTGNTRYIQYAFYNATGGSLSGDKSNFGANVSTTAQNGSYYTTLVEMASNVAFITATTQTALSMTQANISTYAIRNFTSATQNVGVVSNPVSAYARENSTPNSAAFLASTSGTLTSSFTATGTASPTRLQATLQVKDINTCVMPNGDIVIATTGTSPYPITLYVYNATGTTLKNTITAFTGSSGNNFVSICVLTNGNLLVVYNGTLGGTTSSNTICGQIYNSSYTLVSTTQLVNDGANLTGTNYAFNVSAMTNSRFVLGYWNGGNGPVARVFNSDATLYSTLIAPGSTSDLGTAVAGTADGGFVIRFSRNNVTGVAIYWYKNTSGANYTPTTLNQYATAGASNPFQSCTVAVATNGTALSYYLDSGTTSYPMLMDTTGAQTNISGFNTNSGGSYGVFSMCTMPNNNLAVLKLDSGGGGSGSYIAAVIGAGCGASLAPILGTVAFGFASNAPMAWTSADGPIPSICATFDSQLVVAYLDTSQYPCFFILNMTSASYSSAVVAGTTASLPAYYPSQANGHILKGVSVTAATAGGTGVVQTNGQTQLNSQYPATTTAQAFDSTGTVTQGTKGTIVGRNVTMTGGV